MAEWRGYVVGAAAVAAAGGLWWAIATDEPGPMCLTVGPNVVDRIMNTPVGPEIETHAAHAVHAPWIERRDEYGYESYHVIALRFTTPDGEPAVGTWAYASDESPTAGALPLHGTFMAIDDTARRWSNWPQTHVTIRPDDRATQQARDCL